MMKKLFMIFAAMFAVTTMNAQKAVETSRFTDNMSITLQGGVVTTFNDFFENGSTTPVIVLGVDKYINPWLGVGIEGRTSIGVGENYNTHTAFDMVNVSCYVKFNVLNMFNFNGTKRTFEPVIYTGLGWNHVTCSDAPTLADNYSTYLVPTEYIGADMRNSLSYRAGVEFNFNLGKEKAWGIVVNPSVVWANIDNGRIDKRNGSFEITAGVRYNFLNTNGTRTFKVYDIAAMNDEINALRAENDVLKNIPVKVIESTVIKEVKYDGNIIVPFEQNSSVLTEAGKAILTRVPKGSVVGIIGAASPEGTATRNSILSCERAQAVADYLIRERECEVEDVRGDDAGRIAIVTFLR